MEEYLKDYSPVLTLEDTAEILGVSPRTIRKLVLEGNIVGIKVGRSLRIPKDKLIDYLENKGGICNEQ